MLSAIPALPDHLNLQLSRKVAIIPVRRVRSFTIARGTTEEQAVHGTLQLQEKFVPSHDARTGLQANLQRPAT